MKNRKVFLPKIYKGENEKYQGKPMISWSQIETWNSKAGFNTGMKGNMEYMLKYFIGATFPDMGWGQFGGEVEDYICTKDGADKFTVEEKATLDKIIPYGTFQQEIIVDFGDFIVLGFIDDATADFKKLRDYKTKSEASKKDLHDDKKHQLEIYTLWIVQEFGYIPDYIEYCIIDRLGGGECMKGGGRDVLKVGERIWYEPYTITPERLEVTKQLVIDTVNDISEAYATYVNIFGTNE